MEANEVYTTPSCWTNPSPPTVIFLSSSTEPLYSFVALAEDNITFLGLMIILPFCVCTSNWLLTSFPSSSLMEGTPLTATSYSPALIPETLASMPVSVYVLPSISKVFVFNPSMIFSSPSYRNSPLLPSTVIAYLVLRLTTVNMPLTTVIS